MSTMRKGRRTGFATAEVTNTRPNLERALEEGLRETFPASDAVAVTEPAATAPGNSVARSEPVAVLRAAFYSYGALAQLFARKFYKALEWAQSAIRIPNCHYWPFAHRVAALGHMQREEELKIAVAELLQRKPEFSCGFARKRLFYVKNLLQLDGYVEGLRKAGIPE